MTTSNNTHAETQPASSDPRAFGDRLTLESLREQAATFKKNWMIYPEGSRFGVWSGDVTQYMYGKLLGVINKLQDEEVSAGNLAVSQRTYI
jgi:hypothetical protein